MPDKPAAPAVAIRSSATMQPGKARRIRIPPGGEIVSGHADRHVVRVILGQGRRRFVAYLKREHRVRLRDRFSSWWAGYGWVSKSVREARVLAELRKANIPVPHCLGAREDASGRACVLIRGTAGALDLRTYLYRDRDRPASQRREFAKRLGRLIAAVHQAGFDCPDLSSKHVLVQPRNRQFTLIDWQRARRRRVVPRAVRIRELAALNATLADAIAEPRERLHCLRAYLDACGIRESIRLWANSILRQSDQLLRRRWVRELRRPPIDGKAQRLRWIGGEHLCVTRHFWRECRERAPTWLVRVAHSSVPTACQTERTWNGRRVVLRQFPPANRMRQLWLRIQRKHEVAVGPRQAALIFRLERHDIAAPEVLAFGQRPDGASFILTRPRSGTIPAQKWLAHRHPRSGDITTAIRALHDQLRHAGYAWRSESALHVGGNPPIPVLDHVDQLVPQRHRAATKR